MFNQDNMTNVFFAINPFFPQYVMNNDNVLKYDKNAFIFYTI